MDTRRHIATLAKELGVLRQQHAEQERSVASGKQAGVAVARDKTARKIAAVEEQIANLQDEAEIDTVEELIAECSVTDPDVLTVHEIKEHARLCDEHAAALAVNIKALHTKITALRMKRGGRGPSSIVVPSALERAAAKHFTGTVLRSIRGPVPRPGMGGFKEQVEMWMPSLAPPKKNVAA
jgi:hypothetical protein